MSTKPKNPELPDDSQIKDYIESLKKNAENLLLKQIPAKIVKLNDLLEKLNFHNVNLSNIHQDVNIPRPSISEERYESRGKRNRRMMDTTLNSAAFADLPKVYTLPNGPSPCNKPLSDMIRMTKPYFRQLLEDASTIKMWISYLIPKIEDGNNIGVSILEWTRTHVKLAEAKAQMFLVEISVYFMNRAKILSKVVKYPHIEDYRRAVRELDEKEYNNLWFALNEVKDLYCKLHDIVTKNLEKIKTPRVSHMETLY